MKRQRRMLVETLKRSVNQPVLSLALTLPTPVMKSTHSPMLITNTVIAQQVTLEILSNLQPFLKMYLLQMVSDI